MSRDEIKDTIKQRFTSKFTLSAQDEEAVFKSATLKSFKNGERIYPKDGCLGYAIIISGRARGLVSTSNFKEITVFNLQGGDSCMLCGF